MPQLRVPGAFVGRAHEVEALCGALAAACQGAGGIVLIGGEPGIGKTRLTAEFAERARADGWLVLTGAAYDAAGMPPYLPFIEALQEYARSSTTAEIEAQLGPAAPAVALLLPEVHRRLPNLPASAVLDPQSERFRLFESLTDLLIAAARRPAASGLLLCLDDLHWADETTLLLLEHLVRRTGDVPLLVAGTYRDSEVDAGRPLARTLERLARRAPGIRQHLTLQRLPEAGVAELLCALAGRELPAAVVQSVHAETEGNPFFVHEVYQYLAASGRLVDAGSEWPMEVRFGEVEVPPSIRLVLERRLESVSTTCRQALVAAATIGRAFAYALLLETAGLEETALLDALEEAGRAHLLAQPAESAGGRMTFAHELIRQTLLAGLSLPRRQQLHRRVAEGIERMYAGKLDPHLASLALHYRQAGAAADLDRAVTYSLQAGEAAWSAYAYELAASHLQAALALLQEQQAEPERRAAVLERLGDLMLVTGFDRRAGAGYLEQARDLLVQAGRSERAGLIDSKLGSHFCNFPFTDIPRALAYYRAAERAWQRSAVPSAWTARLYNGLATAYCQAVDTREGLAAAQLAVEVAGAEGVQDGTWALVAAMKAWHLMAAGRLAEGIALFDQAWETGDRHRNQGSTWTSAWTAGVCTHLIGDPLAAQNWVRRELDRSRLATGGGSRRLQMGLLGYWQVESGDLADASHNLAAAGAEAWVYFLGQLQFREGHWEKVAALMIRSRAVAVQQGDRFNVALAGFDLAKVLATLGRPAEAVTLLEEGLCIALEGASVLLELWARQGLALLYATSGRPGEAHPHLARCRAVLAGGEDWRGMAGRVALAEAAFAAAKGRTGPAEAAFQRAIAIFRRYTLPWDEAEALHLWGQMLIAGGSAPAGREHLAAAASIYRRHGAGEIWPEHVGAGQTHPDGELSTEPPQPAPLDGLTSREREILQLVVTGCSNREVALQLVLSVRTVERHIENIYLKTGMHSRGRLMRYVQEQERIRRRGINT